MPEVDGLSVCAHVLSPDRPPVNVIVITGSRDPDTLERCEGFGAQYARKGPTFWDDLEAALIEFYPRMAKEFGLPVGRPRVLRYGSGRACCSSMTTTTSTVSSPADCKSAGST